MLPADNTSSPSAPAAPMTTHVIASSLRDPGKFSAQHGLEVDDGLTMYERVSQSHRWDPAIMLANIIYLDGTPRVWFHNHEADITSWDTFKEKLRDVFGNPSDPQQAARKELATRAESSTESYVSHSQEVPALRNKVDETTPKVDKVGNVLRGIAEDGFKLLVYKNVAIIVDVVKECCRFELAKSRHVMAHFTRLPNTAASSSCAEHADTIHIRENATRIVRIEHEAANAAPYSLRPLEGTIDNPTPAISLIQAVVWQEIADHGFQTACFVSPPDFRLVPMATPRNDPYFVPRTRNGELATTSRSASAATELVTRPTIAG